MTEKISVLVPPLSVEIDGARVFILEASSYNTLYGAKRHIVSCKIVLKNFATPVFPLDVANNDELLWKLKAEISKIKLLLLSGESV